MFDPNVNDKKIDPKLIKKVKPILDRAGVTYPELINMLLLQIIQKNQIDLEFYIGDMEELPEEMEEGLGRAIEDFKAGRFFTIEPGEDIEAHFKAQIKRLNKEKKHENRKE